MSWQLVDAPSHIAPEVGANLLAGAGPWTAPLVLDGEYVLTVEVLGGGVVEWVVTGADGEGLPVTVPGLSETVPDGEWVRVTIQFTAPGFVGDAAVSLTVPGESRNPVLGELTGRTVLTVPGDVLAETIMASGGIIAGTPGGARVELTENGLHAFDAAGVETANIQGEGGTYRGGAFYTHETDGTSIYMHNTARNQWPALVFKTPNLYQPGGIAGHDGVLTDYGVWPNGTVVVNSGKETSTGNTSAVASGPNGAQLVARSGESRTYVVANSNGRAELLAASGAVVQADELGGGKVEGALGNRVTAGAAGSAELQSSGGATVSASSNGSAEIRSSGGAEVIVRPDGGVRINGADTSPVYVDAPGSFRILRAQSTNSYPNTRIDPATGTVLLSTVDVAGIIADLEARIAALESA